LDKIVVLQKSSNQYKEQDKKVSETLIMLLDLDRTHSMEYLKMQKTA
jgi:5-bromo-4-chloroindolyl phosphate hydrolysis protein